MPRIYKVCVLNNSSDAAIDVFAIKPYLDSFDSFKDEIYIRMPELKNQPMRIFYEDEDGDKITIFNALDFGIFQEQKIKKVFIKKKGLDACTPLVAPAPVAAATAPTASVAPNASMSAPQARVLHPNVICDGCDKSIFGYRYKCLECADFDLCMECEPKSHNHHLMVRISDPNDAEICYRSKLGKRFLRHRRSESLCMKAEEKEKEKEKRHHHGHGHHKRHASTASGIRPPTVGDVICSLVKSFAPQPPTTDSQQQQSGVTTEANNKQSATVGGDAATTSTSAGNRCPWQQKASSSTNATQTPTNPPAYGFEFFNPKFPQSGKQPCVPLKHGIDMLSHAAQNFAAMMDPFAAMMEQNANAYKNVTATAPTAPTPTTAEATAETVTQTAPEPPKSMVVEETEPLIGMSEPDQQTAEESGEKSIPKDQNVMIVDCSDDDDDEDLRNLVTSMNVGPKSIGDAASEPKKNDERSGSIESDKGSPSREWTFIDTNEIAESAGAVGGAIPKKVTPPPSAPAAAQAVQPNVSNNVDYAELSRLLSTHIVAQNQADQSTSTQTDAKVQGDTAENAAKSIKTPPPTPMHPDARVNESLNAMMAMGFSNEGGWLAQLLETVDGSIPNALDLLQPHK